MPGMGSVQVQGCGRPGRCAHLVDGSCAIREEPRPGEAEAEVAKPQGAHERNVIFIPAGGSRSRGRGAAVEAGVGAPAWAQSWRHDPARCGQTRGVAHSNEPAMATIYKR